MKEITVRQSNYGILLEYPTILILTLILTLTLTLILTLT